MPARRRSAEESARGFGFVSASVGAHGAADPPGESRARGARHAADCLEPTRALNLVLRHEDETPSQSQSMRTTAPAADRLVPILE